MQPFDYGVALNRFIKNIVPKHYFPQDCKNNCGRNRREKSAYCQECSLTHK
jgi:hypothetical protein